LHTRPFPLSPFQSGKEGSDEKIHKLYQHERVVGHSYQPTVSPIAGDVVGQLLVPFCFGEPQKEAGPSARLLAPQVLFWRGES
jgi:hypothetical protein